MLVRTASLTKVVLKSIQNLCFIAKEEEEKYIALSCKPQLLYVITILVSCVLNVELQRGWICYIFLGMSFIYEISGWYTISNLHKLKKTKMALAILENERSLLRPSVASILPKENDKQASTKTTSKDKQPLSAVVQNSLVELQCKILSLKNPVHQFQPQGFRPKRQVWP